MSGITLSSAVRQNLLSLQNTASLASVTQNRLATGKKVNSALDNPVNFFTASGLDSRSNDISNLLDGIGNGVQALKAADTGITSLTNLINTAKSIANQALQAQIGYTTKSNVSTTIGGATSTDLRGTTTYTSATASSNVLYKGTAGGTTAAVATINARRHHRRGRRQCGQRQRGHTGCNHDVNADLRCDRRPDHRRQHQRSPTARR